MRVIRLNATPLPTPTPTAIPTPLLTERGALTASMARLGLAAEPFAALGDPAAPITVIEFTDFGCAFCRRHHLLTFPSLVSEYIDSGLVFYVVKHLPVTSPQGALAATAALCAGEQGRYWEMHAALFAADDAWQRDATTAQQRIAAIAADLGLDAAALQACRERPAISEALDGSVSEAHTLRIFGTPTFLINDRLLAGAHPIEVWRAIISELLP